MNTNTTEAIFRCRKCGWITQEAHVSCDCEVPSPNDWEAGFALFGLHDPEAALQAARDEFAHLIRLVEPFLEAGGRIPGLATMNGAKRALALLTPPKP